MLDIFGTSWVFYLACHIVFTQSNLRMFFSSSHSSMSISEYDSYPSLDYDYNDTCDQDGGPELPNGTTILHMLYYMLFFLSVLGIFKQESYR